MVIRQNEKSENFVLKVLNNVEYLWYNAINTIIL